MGAIGKLSYATVVGQYCGFMWLHWQGFLDPEDKSQSRYLGMWKHGRIQSWITAYQVGKWFLELWNKKNYLYNIKMLKQSGTCHQRVVAGRSLLSTVLDPAAWLQPLCLRNHSRWPILDLPLSVHLWSSGTGKFVVLELCFGVQDIAGWLFLGEAIRASPVD